MRRIAIALLLLCAPLALHAQETVLYKCTDAKGAVTMQNGVPCAPGMKQDVRRIGEVKTVPVPVQKPKVDEPPDAPVYGEFIQVGGPRTQRTPAPEAAGLPAPPALFQCTTWKGETYLGETATPEPKCAPLAITGIDGNSAFQMGSACEVKYDECSAIPAEQLCDAWYRRLDDADFKRRYTNGDTERERQAAYESIEAKIKASNCSTVAPTPAP
ncbi:MAG: hypothetical protein QM612_06685 [Thermomonas sp.]|uniref:hypothetical protein n=1 Tax=Thermomonas sp. TaxID=1971895 RepID=UPI0039E590A8